MLKQVSFFFLITMLTLLSCKKNSSDSNSSNINDCTLNKVNGSYNDDNNFEQTYFYNSISLLSEMKSKDYDCLLSYNQNKQLIKIVSTSPQQNKIFDISWGQNQVTVVAQNTTYNGTTSFRLYKPIYKDNKILKYLNYKGNNPNNTILEGYDSLAYDLVGNITKLYHFTTNGGVTSTSTTTIVYDNQLYNDFSYEISPFESFLLFINKTTNNPVSAKTTGSSSWAGYDIAFQYDSSKKPNKITGTYQQKPINLTLTYNCK